jgi:uncharacterized protein
MELSNEFTVDVPVEQAWSILTDVTRIAPCMPGAQLQEVQGDEYRGVVKVKVGPVTAEYRGKATFLEKDDEVHRAVLRAEGRETRGQGNASATITATLEAAGGATRVSVDTDLTITGRVAQFGRGVLAEVSNKLLGQFVACLESTVLAGTSPTGGPDAGSTAASGPGTASATQAEPATDGERPGAGAPAASEAPGGAPDRGGNEAEVEPVDLVRVVGPILLKRVVAVLAALGALWALRRRRRARRRG